MKTSSAHSRHGTHGTHGIRRTHLVLVLAIALLALITIFAGCKPFISSFFPARSTSSSQPNTIQQENQLRGSTAWRISQPATDGQIAGYAGAASINRGGHLLFYVSTKVAGDPYTMRFFRLGYYGGAGARLALQTPTLSGVAQGWWKDEWYTPNNGESVQNCPSCILDLVDSRGRHTHYVDANWQPTYSLTAPDTWISGLYLVLLQTHEGYQSYIPFVIRDDASTSDLLLKANVATWEAYNEWGNYNLYAAWENGQEVRADRAYEVSLNRPYATGDGAGDMLTWEAYMARFLEQRGYDVTYVTSMDVSDNSGLLLNHKALIVAGHDEYWDVHERDAVEAAIADGVSVGFFSANESYVQVRYAPDPAGRPNRVIVCYHDIYHHYQTFTDLQDPDFYKPSMRPLDTTLWRLPPVNRPEDAMVGEMYIGGQVARTEAFPFVVSDASSWIYTGSDLHNGNSIPGVVGYEMDSVVHDTTTPRGLQIVAASPIHNDDGTPGVANATLYTAPRGNLVFAAGTIDWDWALDNQVRYPAPLANTPASWQLITVTKNILQRFLTLHLSTPSNVPAPTPTHPTLPAPTVPPVVETPEG